MLSEMQQIKDDHQKQERKGSADLGLGIWALGVRVCSLRFGSVITGYGKLRLRFVDDFPTRDTWAVLMFKTSLGLWFRLVLVLLSRDHIGSYMRRSLWDHRVF